jgi:hypothetical protein
MDPARVRAWLSPEDNGDRRENTMHASLIHVGRRHVSVNRLAAAAFLPRAGGMAFGGGCRSGSAALSSFASAARNGSKRGAWGNLSSSTARRMAAFTAACSSSVRSIVGMGSPVHEDPPRGDAGGRYATRALPKGGEHKSAPSSNSTGAPLFRPLPLHARRALPRNSRRSSTPIFRAA